MFRTTYITLCLTAMLLTAGSLQAQTRKPTNDHLHIDSKGIIRWEHAGTEAAFFGVNYTVPFAYGYRSHKALGIDPQTAIDNDVYHMARLGINAFRVHVWDTEISDAQGNLIDNEHLRLFDYLVAKLEARGIYILITPIAFWGNGYPEKDEKTGSFSDIYGKEKSLVNNKAIQAQERYLQQFFSHVNPYTHKTYGKDPFVVATEINNEPKHTGPKKLATTYINRLTRAIKNTGWTKPVFYNISESPDYAAAVANSKADGFSFQWYPIGLVAGHEQKGNFLPHVDRYVIPFDTIPAFMHKPRIVYEFDAADILQSYLYPAMARSFRTAGFQWATQFAYDPLATAYGNTEYQTHYLNLAYTPSKAISLMIASEVFRSTPLYKSYGSYPADTAFSVFRLSANENLSEMNREDAFYYSNSTTTQPRSVQTLKHIAGVGSSAVVSYAGNGAYFLDQLAGGQWRLEVMPDVRAISDPFATASPDKAVKDISWADHPIKISLPGLNADFYIKGLNKGNTLQQRASAAGFNVKPGTYLLSNNAAMPNDVKVGTIGLAEFVAPQPVAARYLAHQRTAGKAGSAGLVGAPKESASKSTDTLQGSSIQLFNPANPPVGLNFYLGDWKQDNYAFHPDSAGQKAMLEINHLADQSGKTTRNGGLEIYVKDMLTKQPEPSAYHYLVFQATASTDLPVNINLISGNALSYGTKITLGQKNQEVRIPLSALKPAPLLLLPRPYPGFQSLYFNSTAKEELNLSVIEKLQFSYQVKNGQEEKLRITGIRLEK